MSDAPDTPDNDGRLLAALGRALDADPVPAGLVERAERLLGVFDLVASERGQVDGELARLLDIPELVGTRGVDTGQRLTFGTADRTVSLEVLLAPGALAGQVLAGAVTDVGLEGVDGPVARGQIDGLGRFGFDSAPSGPARLRLSGAETRAVTTDWFLI